MSIDFNTLEDIRDNFSLSASNTTTFAVATRDIDEINLLIQKGQQFVRRAAQDNEESNNTEKVNALDNKFKQLIDLENKLQCHKSTLNIMKESITRGERIKDVSDDYQKQNHAEMDKLASNEDSKYHNHPSYVKFRQAIWNINHPDEMMPSLTDVQEDDDIVMGPSKISLKCPLTTTWFEEPVTNAGCKHTFSKSAILSLLQKSNVIRCPIPGCNSYIQKNTLSPDEMMVDRVKRAKARETQEQQLSQFFDVE